MERAHSDEREGRIGIVSVVIPAYNECATIAELLAQLRSVPWPTQIIVVDDGSSDGTTELLEAEAAAGTIELTVHPANRGKGAAIRSGLALVRGDVVVVQDADLEYQPADYPLLLAPIEQGIADVVYGSRFLGSHPGMYALHSVGNRILTMTCNVLFGSSLSDLETGYKVLSAEVARSLPLRSDRWGFDPEITARLLRRGYHIHEVPVTYSGRTFGDGKKISWKDGLIVVATLVRYRFFDRG